MTTFPIRLRHRTGALGAIGRIQARMGFRAWAWIGAGFCLGGVTALGYFGYRAAGDAPSDALYRSIQLFGLNFQAPDASVGARDYVLNPQIQAARLLAPVVLLAAVIKLLFDGLGQWVQRCAHVGLNTRPRDIVLGYGPVGRAIGERLLRAGRGVTWIDTFDGGDEALDEARREAEREGGFLLVGDPSSDLVFRRAAVHRAVRIFIALEDDLRGLDAAEALRLWAGNNKILPPVRLFTNSPQVAADLPHAADHGYVSGRDVAVFNLRAEAARRLVLRARWDRLALMQGQERVHLVLAGCGWQGEALFDEVLILCNRAGLKAPLITVLDRDALAIAKRLKVRSPALFDPDLAVSGWLPPRFVACDLNDMDFANLALCREGEDGVPVTAWAFCMGGDDLNLRAAMVCQTAMHRRQIAGAPIHARVWTGHELGQDEITQVNIFGGLKDALDQTTALEDDPDRVSKALHIAYLNTEATTPSIKYKTFGDDAVTRERAVADWAALSASKKRSNRRAQRHAPVKLEDLGFNWHGGEGGTLPHFSPEQRAAYRRAESTLAERHFKENDSTGLPTDRFLAAMQNEHDRWTLDRAIDGWQLSQKRDEGRLLHTDMRPFKELEPTTQAYDGILLLALLGDTSGTAPAAYNDLPIHVDLSEENATQASLPRADWATATHLIVTLPMGNVLRPEKTKLDMDSSPIKTLLDAMQSQMAPSDNFCRLTLVFKAPPTPPILELANALGVLAWARGRDVQAVWDWTTQ